MEEFETFVRARSAALARTAYLLTGDRHLAEDLLQDALARLAERWTAVARRGDPEPYVRRMLYTRAIDGWRARRRRPEVLHSGAGEPWPERAVMGTRRTPWRGGSCCATHSPG